MKIAYRHLADNIKSSVSIDEMSEKLFQLGHEHEISDGIFDMEFTPNRGDCLSVDGLLRDLSVFYATTIDDKDTYKPLINPLSINFSNNCQVDCPYISFLKIEIADNTLDYQGSLQNYFKDLKINKNNFFTDISNYISYETGQPTHCYDASKLDNKFSLEQLDGNFSFETLLGKSIELTGKNLVFVQGEEIINLAGVVGGKSTSCDKNTKTVIVECAYFNPEAIIGKSVKYGIQSESAHKFERNVDPTCHDKVLRRFLALVDSHANIKNIELFTNKSNEFNATSIELNVNTINRIIGSDITEDSYKNYLSRLGFTFSNKEILVPSYRSDIITQNDLAEEIARSIGYDNIPVKNFNILSRISECNEVKANKIKSFLVDNGFFEVINSPFIANGGDSSIKVDNPLDSNREFLRVNLRDSLIGNLLYNERRQKDSIKLFEISDVYSSSQIANKKRVLGVIASGRVGKNYKEFSKKISNDYLKNLFKVLDSEMSFNFENILRENLDTKLKTSISYLEVDLDDFSIDINNYKELSSPPLNYIKYKPISEYPSSVRDISFSITNPSNFKQLEESILNFEHELLKDVHIFDFYKNQKMLEIKIGFRFIFQSSKSTITESEVNKVVSNIMSIALEIETVSIPGLL